MSHQHFYSRVPARVSLFNRRDSFDSFAYSSALDKQFVLGELSLMYQDKLEIHNPVRIRRGEIPQVYTQAMMPSGKIVQTTVTYLPKDFTGERSSYLAHSIVLTEEEKETLFCDNRVDAFNPEMFVGDISIFDLTARNAVGNSAMSDRQYIPRPMVDGKAVLGQYDAEIVKSFIFSVVSAILGEGGEVYFRLPYSDSELSYRALEFINAIMSILPYSLRQRLSFVSYISNSRAYSGFNVKCISSELNTIRDENSVFFDFGNGEIIGLSKEYSNYQAHAAFLYSLFEYKTVRDAFHKYLAGIQKKYPDFELTVKSLTDIIFMFWQCSGFYLESSVVANDESLCNFLDIYAMFREGLEEDYRVKAYRPLSRYLDQQIAIPDSVYSRLSKLYPTECVAAKAVALDVLLGLIHIDVMRERLFAFISRNYAGEIPAVKSVINANLCRVFYGGFLQHRILRHFDIFFAVEPPKTRDEIIDKLLLSIRTPEIQGQILYFFDKHYRGLTPAERLKLCSTCLEMIPEDDELANMMVDFVNRKLCWNLEMSKLLKAGLTKNLDYTLKAGSGRLAHALLSNTGFSDELVLSYILTNNVGVDILVALLADMPAHHRIHKLIRAYAVPGMTDEYYCSLLKLFENRQVRVDPSTMYDILSADGEATKSLSEVALTAIRYNVIYPSLLHTLADAFDVNHGIDGVKAITDYVDQNRALESSAEYEFILNYLSMSMLCHVGDLDGAFSSLSRIPDDEYLRQNIAAYMEKHYEADEEDISECAHSLILKYLKDHQFNFNELYDYYASQFEENYAQKRRKQTKNKACTKRGMADAIVMIIKCASYICESSSVLADDAFDEESGLRAALQSFVQSYGFGVGRFLKKHCEEAYFAIEDMCEEILEEKKSSK